MAKEKKQETPEIGFIVSKPVDQAEYLDGPPPKYMDPTDESKLRKVYKYEQAMAAQGVKPTSPQYPELFSGDGGAEPPAAQQPASGDAAE